MGHWSTYRRRGGGSLPPAAPPVVVLAVTFDVGTTFIWQFSAPIATPPSSLVELEIDSEAGLGLIDVSGDTLTIEYPSAAGSGLEWFITGLPAGLTFVGGGTLAVPQNGMTL